MSSIFDSVQLERRTLAGLLKHPAIFSDIEAWVRDSDYASRLHKAIFAVAKDVLISGNGTLDHVVLARKMESLGINTGDSISVYDYLDDLSSTRITKEGVLDAFKELAKNARFKEMCGSFREMCDLVTKNRSKPLQDVVAHCDEIYGRFASYGNTFSPETIDIFASLESTVEDIANNPPDEHFFMFGPFPTVNRIYGSLHRPGAITIVCARSGGAKTSFGMFNLVSVAEKYRLPILWMDNGEMTSWDAKNLVMTARELQMRAVCMLSEGKVPYWALEQGKWRENLEWLKIVREKVWPRVKKVKVFCKNVSRMSPLETISFIRRFSMNTVGRGNLFLVHYDYLKPFDTRDFDTPEWKQMGHFIQDVKSFISGEVSVPFWASLQSNRMGITTNRRSEDLDDSENIFSISDRILQQSTHSLILREKTQDEMFVEGKAYGNTKAIFVKTRHLGVDYMDARNFVKVGKRHVRNHVNLNFGNFNFEDRGDLRQMIQELKEKMDPVANQGAAAEL